MIDIIIQGAREHNLKNIDVRIPKNCLTVVTGLSGSGKSTLAFDILYAEGQRRYVESLSTYARQFLGQMAKPDVDSIDGLSPAIAIEQKTAGHNPRSTVGTITEIYDYLRLLFARVGTPHCHQCGNPIEPMTVDQICDQILTLPANTRIMLLAPLIRDQKGRHDTVFARMKKQGFARMRVDGKICRTQDHPILEKQKKHTLEVVVDRLVIKPGIEKRLSDSLELALSLSKGLLIVMDIDKNQDRLFSETAACLNCHISYPPFTPASFSFNSPQGACPVCDGLGSITAFDPDLIVPDPGLSLRQGAILPWQNRDSVQFMEFLDALTTHFDQDIYTPFKDLSDRFQHVLLHGSKEELIEFYTEQAGKKIRSKKNFEGVIPYLKRRYKETDSKSVKDELKRYMNARVCSRCKGTRLNPASSHVRVSGHTIWEITRLPIKQTLAAIASLTLTRKEEQISAGIIRELTQRLIFLDNVGLDYLSLSRSADTLSGGESQRIRLATQIGSKLTGILYVLDEPSIGLHRRDNARLIKTLMDLKHLDNTVVVVEHDTDTILASDHVIDMGPAAGVHGGQVIFSGPPEKLTACPDSLTGQYIKGIRQIPIPDVRRKGNGRQLTLVNAAANNLEQVTVSFPLGCFICVTGVSGSGKSSLVLSTLYPALCNQIVYTKKQVGTHDRITGIQHLDKVIHIDQSAIGKTPRSNPGTYTGVLPAIRELFARTPDARARGYKPGRFSFNIRGGRCEACAGDGVIKIEMQFLPDVHVRCDVCKGRQFNRDTLDIRYKGKNIAEVLDMTIHHAVRFFDNISAIQAKLSTLVEVGLGYITLGQSAVTLSGGEAQRIKLARELSKKSTGKTIYILDEPTTGLHADDINRLLSVLDRLVAAGNTVVVIEHNMDVIKYADHLIDMGPEGGDKGGRIIVQGTPEQVAEHPTSFTGYYLSKVLQKKD
ncbi:MAG: excinuclease ABC subunit UvrA [Desulfotignum sp.]|nr:excinuclease ABC subunit UvrA [Desulfotignum sp.]MCF8138255.1 excinuclease ABC subunit UvrA [Desulfotignum sp.]